MCMQPEMLVLYRELRVGDTPQKQYCLRQNLIMCLPHVSQLQDNTSDLYSNYVLFPQNSSPKTAGFIIQKIS